jgi:hypothetical protein
MPSADHEAAQDRAHAFARSDAKLRAMSDLLAYLDPQEAAIVASEIARDLVCGFALPSGGRLQ